VSSVKKAGILIFPGTNCNQDLKAVLEDVYQYQVEELWHQSSFQPDHDIYFIAGGFSYGDYLRSGALAARSLSMKSLIEANQKGKKIVGICNGFQILTEANLLPGALIKNTGLKHICKWVALEGAGIWSNYIGQNYQLPVSHSEGNYIISEEMLSEIENNGQIILRYVENINGSQNNIAGIQNKSGNIIGLMPHPERAIYPQLDYSYSNEQSGRIFFEKILA